MRLTFVRFDDEVSENGQSRPALPGLVAALSSMDAGRDSHIDRRGPGEFGASGGAAGREYVSDFFVQPEAMEGIGADSAGGSRVPAGPGKAWARAVDHS